MQSGTHLRGGLGPHKYACVQNRLLFQLCLVRVGGRQELDTKTYLSYKTMSDQGTSLKFTFLFFISLFSLFVSLQVCGSPGLLPCLSPHPSIPVDKNTCPTHTSTPNKGQNISPLPPSSLHPSFLSLFSALSSSHLCLPHPISSTAPAPGLRNELFPTLSLSQRFTG